MRTTPMLAAVLLALGSFTAQAVDRAARPEEGAAIEGYEPTTVGYTHDSYDVPYMDAQLSLKYRLLAPYITDADRLYLAFTGRFAFYWGSRNSSPVVGKLFNPALLWRHLLTRQTGTYRGTKVWSQRAAPQQDDYFDIGYAHESNGQTISTLAQFNADARNETDPRFALDKISRGWDYLELVAKRTLREQPSDRVVAFATLKYFLKRGLLQGTPEEYAAWEANAEGKPMSAVDGIGGLVEYQRRWQALSIHGSPVFADPRVALAYASGYRSPFRYSTVRIEAGLYVFGLPLTLWRQVGYDSDLAHYYIKARSWGIGLRIGEF